MSGSWTPLGSRITGGRATKSLEEWIMDRVLSLLISAAIIALGNWVVVGTVTKHSSFVWTLMALFPLLAGFISFYDSLKATPDTLSPVPVLPALNGPGLHSNLIEHGARTSEGPMTVWISRHQQESRRLRSPQGLRQRGRGGQMVRGERPGGRGVRI
jgi:hypothetical protein